MRRRIVLLSVLISLLSVSCEKMILGPEEPKPPMPAVYASRLATLLDSLRYALDLPALAGAIVADTGLIEAQAVGCRRYGGPVNVTVNDKFQLGSCTKSFTSVMMALLVDEGKVRWTTTLAELFPEYANSMRAEYRDVTVRDLLSHSAGFVRDPNVTLHAAAPREQRVEVVAWAVAQPPAQQHGIYLYSNLGYIIAGAIIEKLTDRTYEEIVFERVVAPLGLPTAGIGAPGTPGLEDQPLQHTVNHAPILPTSDAHLPSIYDPAGMLHMSVVDWAHYVQWVLACEAGSQNLLHAETGRAITSPAVSTGGGGFYALGWGGMNYEGWAGGKTLGHSGSNQYNYCTVVISCHQRIGFLLMTNQGAVGEDWLLGPAVGRLINFYLSGR